MTPAAVICSAIGGSNREERTSQVLDALTRSGWAFANMKDIGGTSLGILEDAIAFIEGLAVIPLLTTDDIEMRLEDVQTHARIEAASLRKRLADRSTRPAKPAYHCKGYMPDYQAGGDCVNCGRVREDHVGFPDFAGRPAEPAPEVEAGDGMAAGDGQYVVMSSTTVRPFMLGVYETVESATLAQCGSPEKWDIFVRLSTLEAERAKTAAAKTEAKHWSACYDRLIDGRSIADADALFDVLRLLEQNVRKRFMTPDGEAMHVLFMPRYYAVIDTAIASLRAAWERAEAAEASLSRALQDRDEAVRVAVEDEREACARIADAAGQAAAISADRKQATSQSGTSVLTGYVFAKTEAEAIARDIRARRARPRADQRAGEGGEA